MLAPAGRALEVELGAAEAHFLIERAAVEPDRLYVGVEIRRELVASVNAECAERGLRNVYSVFANISVDMPRLFSAESVSRFFLNFPDPWFKSRQHKRRVVVPGLAAEIVRALARGGELLVQTDIFALALEAMAICEGEEALVNLAGPWSFAAANPYGAKSRRERQCEAEGTRIWRLLYRRR